MKTDLSQLSTRSLSALIRIYEDKITQLRNAISFHEEMISLGEAELAKRQREKTKRQKEV
jgi:hypothetical protein